MMKSKVQGPKSNEVRKGRIQFRASTPEVWDSWNSSFRGH
jgi:hypothetical protein